MRLAVTLLVIFFGMFYLPSIIATGYAEQTAAAKAWQYILAGVGIFCCVGLLGLLARSAVVWPVVLWGMAEGAQQAACRLAKPIGGEPPSAPPFSGLCGTDFYWLGIFAALCIAVSLADKLRGKHGVDR